MTVGEGLAALGGCIVALGFVAAIFVSVKDDRDNKQEYRMSLVESCNDSEDIAECVEDLADAIDDDD